MGTWTSESVERAMWKTIDNQDRELKDARRALAASCVMLLVVFLLLSWMASRAYTLHYEDGSSSIIIELPVRHVDEN